MWTRQNAADELSKELYELLGKIDAGEKEIRRLQHSLMVNVAVFRSKMIERDAIEAAGREEAQ